jgi:hypothetical protein
MSKKLKIKKKARPTKFQFSQTKEQIVTTTLS